MSEIEVTPDSGQAVEAPAATESESANAWAATREAVEEIDVEFTPVTEPAEPEAEPAPEPEAEATAEAEGAEPEAEPSSEAEAESVTPESESGQSETFTIEGQDFSWPEGVEVSFKADGQDVKVGNMADLVSLAQKGRFMERRTGEFNQKEREFLTAQQQWQSAAEHYQTQLQQAADALEKALYDEEYADGLREKWDPYRDPEVREGLEAKAKLSQLETEKQQEQQQQAFNTFWGSVGEYIRENAPAMGIPESSHPLVASALWSNLQQANAAIPELVKQAQAQGLDEATAQQVARQYAGQFATPQYLQQLMQQVAQQIGADPADVQGAQNADPESAAAAEAESHNQRVQQKLDNAENARPARSTGRQPPVASVNAERLPIPQVEGTWADKKRAMLDMIGDSGKAGQQ